MPKRDLTPYQGAKRALRVSDENWKGLATDVARAVVRFAFEDLKLERLVAVVVLENIAYWKLLEHIWIKNR